MKKPLEVQIVEPPKKYSDPETKDRLNTAAQEVFFTGNKVDNK